MSTSRNDVMIREQLLARRISDERVLGAMRAVDRALFVPAEMQAEAYDDGPLPIGGGQTISQPFIVGLMTALLHLQPSDRVLEIGSGSGYQTAILAKLAAHVFAAELEANLLEGSRQRLTTLGIANVTLRQGNGLEIFRAEAPFDAILSAAAPAVMPQTLIDQLGEGGRCVIPVGSESQKLFLIEKRDGRVTQREVADVRFVPMRGWGGGC